MPYGAPSRPSPIQPAVAPPPEAARGRRLNGSGRRLLAVGGHQRPHAVGGVRALSYPIIDARQVELELRLPPARDRVEEPDVLGARAALALAAVGHDDVVEGLVARHAPRQANGNHDR